MMRSESDPNLSVSAPNQRRVRGNFRGTIPALTLLLLALPAFAKEPSSALEVARQLNQAFVELAETVSPSVVVIEVVQRKPGGTEDGEDPLLELLPPEFRREFERRRRAPRPDSDSYNGRGSGVVIRADGYILTNTHVVENAEKIRVRFRDGREFESKGSWTDPQSDIAVIKIDAKDLAVAKLGDSSKTRVGEFAIAIGAPFVLDYSVTFGHVSAKGRSSIIPSMGTYSLGAIMDQDFIQTDASINPGNSGGPLVNIEGEVIGINTLIHGLGTGIGFAVPINLAREVTDQLISDGRYARAWLGIGTQPLRQSDLSERYPDLENGLVIHRIETNGPAFKSDLKPGDVITHVDGKPVSTVQELRGAVRAKKVGSELSLDIWRNDKKQTVAIKTSAWPDESISVASGSRQPPRNAAAAPTLGLTVQALTPELASRFNVETEEGVVVTRVEPGSAAESQGLRTGDIITEVEYKPVKSPKEFREAVQAAGKRGVMLLIVREGTPEFKILKDSGD
jgi:serine protease Do